MNNRYALNSTALSLVLITGLFWCAGAQAQYAPEPTAPRSPPTASAAAQPPGAGNTLGEVVVTARGRAETQLSVPISIQTFSATTLAQNNITDVNTLQFQAGFVFNSQGASFLGGGRQFPTLAFRGMTSNYGGGFADSGALFVDGIYISGGAASVTLADVSQVEVLKGPQNVYFGKNTFGGAINLITSHPSEDYHGSATAGYSTKGSYDDVASIEGPIIPGLLTGRLTGELLHQGKQYTSADGGTLGEQDTKGVTAVLYATPTPSVWMQGRIHYSHDHDSEAADGFVGGLEYGAPCAGYANPYFCGDIPSLGSINAQAVLSGTKIPQVLLDAVSSGNFGGTPGILLNKVPQLGSAGLIRDNLQGSIQGGVKLPYDANFEFNAGYNQAQSLNITSSDHTPNNVFTTALPEVSRDFEADARFLTSTSKRLRFVAGANYFRSIYQIVYDGNFFANFANSNPVNEKDETIAAYGSAEFDILSYLTLTAEVRQQHETIYDSALEGQPASLIDTVSKSYNHTLPRFILKYHPSSSTNLYVSYSEGIQPPQLQTSYITGDAFTKAALTAFSGGGDYTKDPKTRVWEVGAKQSLFSNRLFFSIDYYNSFWDNALVETFVFNDPANGCSTLPVVGVSAACPYPGSGAGVFGLSQNHIQGIEFEGTARIAPKLTAHLAFNYTDAIRKHYNDQSDGAAFVGGHAPLQDGKRIELFPEYQGSLDGAYRDHLIGDLDWYAHGLVSYTGKQYVDPENDADIKAHFRVDISAGITKGNIAVEAYITNLFDDKNWDYAHRFPDPTHFFSEAYQGAILGAPNPRNFGFKVSAKF